MLASDSGPPVRSSSPRCSSRAWDRCGTWSCTRRGATGGARDMGYAQHRVVGDLVQADPQAQVVGRQAPLAAEGVEVGDQDEQLVGGAAGNGRTDRRAMCPTIEPAVMATIIGCMAWIMGRAWPPADRRRHPGPGRARRPPGRPLGRAQRARELLEQGPVVGAVRWAQWPRLTGTTVSSRPVMVVDRPVTLATCSSATRASCSSLMRSSGSTFGSLALSVATARARLRRAPGDATPPWPKSLARSPKRGSPRRGWALAHRNSR